MILKKRLRFYIPLLCALLLCACTPTATKPLTTDFPDEEAQIVRLAAVGDIYLTDDMLPAFRLSDGGYDFTSLFSGTVNIFAAADLVFGNFEGTFSGTPYGEQSGSCPDAMAAALHAAGFTVLQTANSYSIQSGMSGLERTLSTLRESGLKTVGTYASEAEQRDQRAVLLEKNGIRIAFIALTKGMNGMSLPAGEEYRVDRLYTDYDSSYSKIDYNQLDRTLSAAKALRPDFIIAGLHWGSENNDTIRSSQEKIADYLVQNGVDVILGSHSHRFSKVEQRSVTVNGTQKKAVIAYSLGDFTAVRENGVNLSAILQIELRKSRETGVTVVGDVSYTATAAVDRGEGVLPRYQILDADAAVALYEGNYYDHVTKEVYDAIVKRRQTLTDCFDRHES